MRTRIALAATISAVAAAAALMAPAGAGATGADMFPACSPGCDLVVNSTTDAPDAHPGDGRCATSAGRCTLRAAVQEANALTDKPPFQRKILVPAGTYVLTRHGLDDSSDRGDLDLHFVGQVIGAGQGRTTIDGDGADRVFDLHASSERVAHLAVTNGRATDGPGGGIRVTGQVDWLEYLYVTDNVAVPSDAPDSGLGGGIAANDTDVAYSLIAYNDAQDAGGIWYHGAQSTLGFDALVQNHATRDGGGLYFSADDSALGPLTISGNTAGAHGGGVFLAPSVRTLSAGGSTIASNTAAEGGGGGIWRSALDQGEAGRSLEGVIVAKNGKEDCAGPGPLTSSGGNIDSDGSCGLGQDTDRSGVDPLIGSVAYNGGPTPTRALLQGSPAIDLWQCSSGRLDQRGATRPQDAACDAGAYEVGSCCPASEPPYNPGSTPPGPRSYCGFIVRGTPKGDLLVGDAFRNELHGEGGPDRIFGRGGSDCLFGGKGPDLVKGGTGHDAIFGSTGADRLYGGASEDFIKGDAGNDRIYGGPDEDRLYGGPGNDFIRGGAGYDIISGGSGNDTIDASRKGLDEVDCGSGDDHVKARRLEHLYRCEHVKYVD
jgi:CSLREA domain-containing protein